jgi:hypothetical protein
VSHEAQEAAADYAHRYMGLSTDPSEWRETDREEANGPYGEKYDHITFTHTSGAELHAVTHVDDGEEWAVMEGGTLLYDVCQDPSMGGAGYSEFGAVFCPKDFWERNNYLMMEVEHQHQAALLMAVHDMPSALADDEVEEGQFALPTSIKTMGDAHAYLQKQGYEYRDMTTARGTPPAVAASAGSNRDSSKAMAADVINALIKEFTDGAFRPVEAGETPPAQLFLGQTLADEFDAYDYGDHVEEVTLSVLANEGIPAPMTNVFSWSDREEILSRLQKAAVRGAANMPIHKAATALAEKKKWEATPPADISGKDMAEVYRLAIRGKVPQIAAIGFCMDDERKGGATEEEMGWFAGYVGHDGKLMRDLYIPDHVFVGWFPEYPKVTWNDYEPKVASNYHTMPLPDEQYVEGVRNMIHGRYVERGAVHVPDMTEDVATPLVPVSTATTTRPVRPGYTAGGASHIVTLKAFPPGHTGKAPPVAVASSSPAETSGIGAPTSVNTVSGSGDLWREYQLDINSLAPLGIYRAGYQVVDTTPHVVFALGFLDEAGGVVDIIPQEEVQKIFSEYTVKCLDDGVTYQINKLFGQQLSDLETVVRERLKDVKIFDFAEQNS